MSDRASSPAPAGGSGGRSRCGSPRTGTRSTVNDVNKAGAEEVAAEITAAGGRAARRAADVSDRDAVFALVDRSAARAGQRRRDGRQRRDRAGEDAARGHARGPAADLAVNLGVVLLPAGRRRGDDRAGQRREDHHAASIAGHSGLRPPRPLQRDEVRGAGAHPGRGQGAGPAQDHRERLLPGHRRHDMWELIDEGLGALPRHRQGRGVRAVLPADRARPAADRPRTSPSYVSYLAGPDADYMTGQAGIIDGGIVMN